jgi:hypothetical protein
LDESAEAVNETGAGVRSNIMEDDGDSGIGGFEDAEDVEYAVGKTARRPGEGGVLDEDPLVVPGGGGFAQAAKGARPAGLFPRDAMDFQFEIVGREGGAQVTAVFFDGVGGQVAFAE